jgi:hypothetical protein
MRVTNFIWCILAVISIPREINSPFSAFASIPLKVSSFIGHVFLVGFWVFPQFEVSAMIQLRTGLRIRDRVRISCTPLDEILGGMKGIAPQLPFPSHFKCDLSVILKPFPITESGALIVFITLA